MIVVRQIKAWVYLLRQDEVLSRTTAGRYTLVKFLFKVLHILT